MVSYNLRTYYLIKVQLFWKGQKNLRNFPHGLEIYFSKCPNHEEDCANFCGPSQKSWTLLGSIFQYTMSRIFEFFPENMMHLCILNQHEYYLSTLQRPDQYKMKILVFSIQYDFQILKYQYSIWRILNKYQYQYAEKTEVSIFSISILSGPKPKPRSSFGIGA